MACGISLRKDEGVPLGVARVTVKPSFSAGDGNAVPVMPVIK